MQSDVVQVEELDEQRVRQHQPLQGRLAGQPRTRSACQIHCARPSAPPGPITANEPASCHSANSPIISPLSWAATAIPVSRGRSAARSVTAVTESEPAMIAASGQESSRFSTCQARLCGNVAGHGGMGGEPDALMAADVVQ